MHACILLYFHMRVSAEAVRHGRRAFIPRRSAVICFLSSYCCFRCRGAASLFIGGRRDLQDWLRELCCCMIDTRRSRSLCKNRKMFVSLIRHFPSVINEVWLISEFEFTTWFSYFENILPYRLQRKFLFNIILKANVIGWTSTRIFQTTNI